MNKCVKLINCPNKLHFVKAIKEVTGKSLLEAKNIADLVIKPHYDDITGKYERQYGTLLLNESSITPEQWEEIAKNTPDLKWEYV